MTDSRLSGYDTMPQPWESVYTSENEKNRSRRSLPPRSGSASTTRLCRGDVLSKTPGASIYYGGVADYNPSVDGYVLPDDPYAWIRAGKHNPMEVVVGTTADEYADVVDLIVSTPIRQKSRVKKRP